MCAGVWCRGFSEDARCSRYTQQWRINGCIRNPDTNNAPCPSSPPFVARATEKRFYLRIAARKGLPMKTRMLQNLEVSEVGMGCMAFSHGYGQIPPEQYSIEAIRGAYEHGCTFFDTAEVYSPGLSGIGHNERIVGKALHDVRDNVVLATKLFLGRGDFGGGSVYDELRASPRRWASSWRRAISTAGASRRWTWTSSTVPSRCIPSRQSRTSTLWWSATWRRRYCRTARRTALASCRSRPSRAAFCLQGAGYPSCSAASARCAMMGRCCGQAASH